MIFPDLIEKRDIPIEKLLKIYTNHICQIDAQGCRKGQWCRPPVQVQHLRHQRPLDPDQWQGTLVRGPRVGRPS